jgi:hypothetical protein
MIDGPLLTNVTGIEPPDSRVAQLEYQEGGKEKKWRSMKKTSQKLLGERVFIQLNYLIAVRGVI